MRRWLRLSQDDKRRALHAAVLVTLAVAGLRLVRLQRMLGWADRPTADGALLDHEIRDCIVAVQRAGRVVPRATCLPQSLALARMLRKKGVPANVRIGVKADGAFAAHAWVDIPAGGSRLALCALRDDADLELGGYVPMDFHRDR